MNKELHRMALQMEMGYDYVMNGTTSIQDWRVGTKYLMEDVIETNHELGVSTDYRREPWGFLGSVYFVFTTSSTIGKFDDTIYIIYRTLCFIILQLEFWETKQSDCDVII